MVWRRWYKLVCLYVSRIERACDAKKIKSARPRRSCRPGAPMREGLIRDPSARGIVGPESISVASHPDLRDPFLRQHRARQSPHEPSRRIDGCMVTIDPFDLTAFPLEGGQHR